MRPPSSGTGLARLPAWAIVSPSRRTHIERVAALVDRWAGAMGVPSGERERWLRAAWLHDALRDAPGALLAELAPAYPGPDDLRHGPAAAARAEAEGEYDEGVLSAVRHHSTGYPGWDETGRVLYCADYLEPGRTFETEERAALADRFPADPSRVIQEVAHRRVRRLVDSGWPLPEHTVGFWNSLTDRSSAAPR